MKKYIIPFILFSEIVFPRIAYEQPQVNILRKTNDEAIKKLDDIKKEESEFGKKVCVEKSNNMENKTRKYEICASFGNWRGSFLILGMIM